MIDHLELSQLYKNPDARLSLGLIYGTNQMILILAHINQSLNQGDNIHLFHKIEPKFHEKFREI